MPSPVRTRRKNAFNLFREAQKLASFDEFPMLRPEIDPQLHLSRNEVDQPFHLICQKDTVVAQVSGSARVMFSDGPVRYFDLQPGDFVYVPGGVAHRILTTDAGEQFRYKAREPGLEGAVWYCDNCGEEFDRHIWDANAKSSQSGYQFACERHNTEEERRRCSVCGTTHDLVDLAPFRWKTVADALSLDEDEAA